MQIYNTMTRRKEELVPLKPGEISIYVCGPTVYSFIHIGNARPLIVFDTLRRYLEYRGYKVKFVQNFTDVDDKVIRRANEDGCSIRDVAEKYIAEYYKDAEALNVKKATVAPRATEHMDEIISLIKGLIEKGHAYPADNGDVYFAVRSYDSYGKLTGQSIESLESGARIDPGEHKRDPLDFALWKSAKPGEPSWDSPWGKGRPGWHIECSAMSMSILGETFDIHAINIEGQKMSKSLGNFRNVRDIISEFDPNVLRLFMLGAHYASPINFRRELMEQTAAAYERLCTARERLREAQTANNPNAEEEGAFAAALEGYKQSFIEAMDDDLNTADAIGVLFELVRAVNTFVTEKRSKAAIDNAARAFDELTGVLGISTDAKSEEFPEEAVRLLNERTEARAAKNWALADELRNRLAQLGFAVEDSKQGAKLKRI